MPPKKATQRRPAPRTSPAPRGGLQKADDGSGTAQAPGSGPGGGAEVMWLDPRTIHWDEDRITSEYRDDEWETLSASLDSEGGQQQPIGIYLVDGEYWGADGYNRCMDAIEKGKLTVLCLVRRGTAEAVRLSNIATALNRGSTNPMNVAETLLADIEMGMDLDALAHAAGKSVEWVKQRLELAQASPVVKQALRERLITVGVAELLARIESYEDQEATLHKVLQERWTVAELEEYLSGAGPDEGEPEQQSRRAPAVRNPQTCTICHVQQAGTIQAVHVCDQCMKRIGKPGEASSEPGADGLVAEFRRALPELKNAQELLARIPGGGQAAGRIGELVEALAKEPAR